MSELFGWLENAKIAADLDMSARQIERMLADMKAKGIICRIGANRNGY